MAAVAKGAKGLGKGPRMPTAAEKEAARARAARDQAAALQAAKDQAKAHAQARLLRRRTLSVVKQLRSLGRSSLDEVDLSTIKSVVHVKGGSGGILLGCFEQGMVCIKPYRTAAQAQKQLFADYLADELGIPTARLRIVPASEKVVLALCQAGHDEAATHSINVEQQMLQKVEEAKFLGLVEFVQGPIMEEEDFLQHLDSEELQQRFWQQAGQLAAYDCLINNWDRLPLIWANQGNLKNIMLDFTEELRVVGIDPEVTPLDGVWEYRHRLQSLVRGLWGADVAKRMEAMNEAIQAQLPFQVHPQGLKQGLQQAFRRIAWRWPCGCSLRCAQKVGQAFSESCDISELLSLHHFVEVAGATVAEEIERLEMMEVPKAVADTFRKLIPEGELQVEEWSALLRLLDPTETLVKCFVHAPMSCSELLRLIYGPGAPPGTP